MIASLVVIVLIFLAGIARANHLALLSGTLMKFERNACDGETMTVDCPNGTLISVVGVTYQRSTNINYLCMPKTDEQLKHMSSGTESECDSSSALLAVVNLCQEKQKCSFLASKEVLGGESCPKVRKLTSVEYRCRPRYFKKKVICEGQTIKLRCPRSKRLAIYSAEFGRSPDKNVLECPLSSEWKDKQVDECQASYATEMVLSRCHGEKRCSISATTSTFGNPCRENIAMYLVVQFTCAPKEILKTSFKDSVDSASGQGDIILPDYVLPNSKENFGSTPYPNLENQSPTLTQNPNELRSGGGANDTDMQSDERGEENRTTKVPGIKDEVVVEKSEGKGVGFVTGWISAYTFIKDNKEKFILYLTVSLSVGLIVLLIVVSARLYVQKKRKKNHSKMIISDPVPSMFDENSSELEHFGSDTTEHPESIDVVRYTNRSTLRRQNSDNRAPVAMSLNNYYYS